MQQWGKSSESWKEIKDNKWGVNGPGMFQACLSALVPTASKCPSASTVPKCQSNVPPLCLSA
eukprot:1160906-Pelagomonas_calceolata.AAC.2